MRARSAFLVLLCCLSACAGRRQCIKGDAAYEARSRSEETFRPYGERSVDLAFATFLTEETWSKVGAGEYDAAVQTAEIFAQLTEIVYGPRSPETVNALNILANVYCEVDRCGEGQAWRERAERIRAQNGIVTVSYVPFEVATYEPVTIERIDSVANCRCSTRMEAALARELAGTLQHGVGGSFEDGLVRLKVSGFVKGEILVVDSEGGVRKIWEGDTEETLKLPEDAFRRLKNIMLELRRSQKCVCPFGVPAGVP